MRPRSLGNSTRGLRLYSQAAAHTPATPNSLYYNNMTRTSNDMLEERVLQKRARQKSAIPAAWHLPKVPSPETGFNALEFIRQSTLLSPKEREITETTDAKILLDQLAAGELSSVDVTTAFCKRAALAHQLTNCCTEIFFDEALEAARHADAHLAKTGKTLGPLHGLPVSMKDLFRIKGQDSTIGWIGLVGKPAVEDGPTTQVIRRLGGILYVKSSIPQSMMMSDCYNHLFGQCVNTVNTRFISGGSSGGESSLVSAQGSIVGIGSDLGGSVRIPAALCGVYGLSPTTSRHPYEQSGCVLDSPRQSIVPSTAGPMTTSLSSIEAYMSALAQIEPWHFDPGLIPVPWRSELCTTKKRLRIGYVVDDGVVKVQPPVARAVKKVIAALHDAGHEVFEWDARSHGYCYDMWERGILSDGGEGARKMSTLSGEALVEGMLVGTEKDLMNTSELHKLQFDKAMYEREYLQRWTDSGVDALIMPVTPWVGYPPWTWVKSHQYVGYTSVWNFVNYAALTMPITTVNQTEDQGDEAWRDHVPRNASDEFNHKQYNVDSVEGLPVGVQVVGGKYGEEKCIAVAKVIESLLK
ncbi:hypothetical protein NUU61_007816 [Penicillium alfredii]|uniref:amidase n=1 Tax=Penicillium alfredii TaxID=1506179 RepID=A0A9W9ERD5_9EURO|nr:uncharacterized protein NUU61_007816 [Penicillium alfredii]KAJ5086509.1 hypothetical protein NUU61_007816 [Penicillium alfredii]